MYSAIKHFLKQVFNKLINVLSESEACQGSGYILINSQETHGSIITRGSLIWVCGVWLTEETIIIISLDVSILHSWKYEVLQ